MLALGGFPWFQTSPNPRGSQWISKQFESVPTFFEKVTVNSCLEKVATFTVLSSVDLKTVRNSSDFL